MISMQQIQELLIQIHINKTVGGGQTSNCNTRNFQEATVTRQGKPHKPLPDFANKYFWTHGKCAYKGSLCNNKAPKHHYISTFSNKRGGSAYRCT